MRNKPTNRLPGKRNPEIAVLTSCGNVFADLGFADADVMLAKSMLAARIWEVISSRGLTQKQAAAVLGIDQPRVSDLIRGHLGRFSSDRLIRFLNALGQDVDIVVKSRSSRPRRVGRLRVRNGTARPSVPSRLRP